MKRNERKRSILHSLARYGALTKQDLASIEDAPVSHIKVYLWRYKKQGLLLKYRDGSFGLSDRGCERLSHLLGVSEVFLDTLI